MSSPQLSNTQLRMDIVIEATRLFHFSSNNQLVQAHALAQKIERMIQDEIYRESPTAATIESHPLWGAFRAAHRAKVNTLLGKSDNTRIESETILSIARDVK